MNNLFRSYINFRKKSRIWVPVLIDTVLLSLLIGLMNVYLFDVPFQEDIGVVFTAIILYVAHRLERNRIKRIQTNKVNGK